MNTQLNPSLKSHYAYLKKLECFALEQQIKDPSAPTTLHLASITGNEIVWQIELPNQKPCFMRSIIGGLEDEYFVVHVDAKRFYYHWLLSSVNPSDRNRPNHCVLLKDMPQDYKFNDAVKGFADCVDNPVPLALAFADHAFGNPYIGFTNGVTRTMWLLVQGVKSFPIEVHGEDSANQLYELAGIGESPMSYRQLKIKHNVQTPPFLSS